MNPFSKSVWILPPAWGAFVPFYKNLIRLNKQTDRETHRLTQTHTHTLTYAHRHTDTRTHRHTDRQTDRHTNSRHNMISLLTSIPNHLLDFTLNLLQHATSFPLQALKANWSNLRGLNLKISWGSITLQEQCVSLFLPTNPVWNHVAHRHTHIHTQIKT